MTTFLVEMCVFVPLTVEEMLEFYKCVGHQGALRICSWVGRDTRLIDVIVLLVWVTACSLGIWRRKMLGTVNSGWWFFSLFYW